MKLRSGRILKSVREKTSKAKINHLSKQFQAVTLNDPQSDKILRDLKKLFELTILEICERITFRIQIENIRPEQEQRSHGLQEFQLGSCDEMFFSCFWPATETRVWQTFSSKELLELVPFIMDQEYQMKPEDIQYMYIEAHLKRHVADFFETLTSTRLFQRYDAKKRSVTNYTSRGYDLYLECMAKKIALDAVNIFFPILRCSFVPPASKLEIPWEQIVNNAKNNCCYIPVIDGGCTVVKRVSFHIMYNYTILDTNITFTSIEKNPKKAFFMHRKCSLSQSCPLEFIRSKTIQF